MKFSIIRGHIKSRPFLFIATIIVAGLIVTTSSFVTASVSAQDKYIVTVFDRDSEKSYATNAKTVGEALERAEITINQGDIVEPGLQEEINSDSFNINIYRARTITVVDGENEVTLPTAYRSPEAIAQAAGLTVYPEDEYSFERVDNFIIDSNVGLRLIIHRATPVKFKLYGSIVAAHTQLDTVKDFINEQGVVLEATDTVKPSLKSKITPNMEVSVFRVGKNTITVEEDVAFGRDIIQDTAIPFGIEKVKTPGVKGLAKVTYEVTYYDGNEVSRTKIQSVVTKEPKTEIVIRGTKAVAISGSRETWLRTVGISESDWGYVDYIIAREAGWAGVTKWNRAGSGAYGICQALPGSKMASAGDDWATNGATQLRWCDGYAKGRYGSWENAYNFWLANNWW